MLEAAATQGMPSKAFQKFVQEQVYMPTPAEAPKQVIAPQAGSPTEDDTTQDLTPLLTAASHLVAAIDAIDFTTLAEKDRKDVFEHLGKVRNRIDGLFMTYEE